MAGLEHVSVVKDLPTIHETPHLIPSPSLIPSMEWKGKANHHSPLITAFFDGYLQALVLSPMGQ